MPGEMVAFSASGGTTSGYLVSPAGGQGPGVLILREQQDLSPHILRAAERLACADFLVLLPDLDAHGWTDSSDVAEPPAVPRSLVQVEPALAGAAAFLHSHPNNSAHRVGMVGFGTGGTLALYAATRFSNVSACVVFCGGHYPVEPFLSDLRVPLLGHYAESDRYVALKSVRQLQERLRSLGKNFEFHVYPGIEHEFFNDGHKEVYNRAAAEDAWKRTVAFLRKHLFWQ